MKRIDRREHAPSAYGLSFILAVAVVVGLTAPVRAQILYDGAIIDRLNKWDSYPTHLFYDGKHHVWWCSRSSVSGTVSQYVDGIFHVVKTGSLGPGDWTGWQEVLNHANTPWPNNHVCDPSVIRGSFSYNSNTYSHALYWTSDTNSTQGGIDNAVGVAFSNDGLTWVPLPTPVITTYNPPNGTYGAGAGGVALDPTTGKLLYAYDDTTLSGPTRLKESTDGRTFTPTPPYETRLYATVFGSSSPDISFNPQDSYWYATVQLYDVAVYVLRSRYKQAPLAQWDVLGVIDVTTTGNVRNNNPGLGKDSNSHLFVDSQGWAYVFFGTGTDSPSTWQVAQARFRAVDPSLAYYTVTPCRAYDSRQQGGALSSGAERVVQITSACGVHSGANAVVVNVTAVDATAEGEISAYPDSGTNTTVVAFRAVDARAGFAVLRLSATEPGRLVFRPAMASGGSVHLIVDVFGFFN